MSRNAEQRLSMILNALGDNAEDVAHLLQFGGWRGLPHNINACPVALYLRTVVTDVTDAAVSSDYAMVHTSDGAEVSVDLSPAVAGFVLAFDLGTYPELIETATDDNGDVIDDLDR
ncbi:hypothetical protein [Actinoplanes sp. N902-109]|uniref:hypothetical protein n=1 Tax=Actinoplanes sp. (strain N902-109) TaxID=649831 RepID=UPI0003AA2332|nr:hypothetical protein [Actinoplanes sp. N902-109]